MDNTTKPNSHKTKRLKAMTAQNTDCENGSCATISPKHVFSYQHAQSH